MGVCVCAVLSVRNRDSPVAKDKSRHVWADLTVSFPKESGKTAVPDVVLLQPQFSL